MLSPIKIILILVLGYLLYRLYISGRKKGFTAGVETQRQSQASIDEVLVQDPSCGAYVGASRSLSYRRDGKEYHFCSEKCRDEFIKKPK